MRLSLVIAALLLAGCSTLDVRGTSVADRRLQLDTYKLLTSLAHADLQCRTIDHVEVSNAVRDGMAAREDWTAFGCKRSQLYAVTYTPSPSGGYFVSVTQTPH